MASADQLERALRNADAAGDVDAARQLAGALKALRSGTATDAVTDPNSYSERSLASSSAFLDGLPIVGPYVQSGVEHLSAGIRSGLRSDETYGQSLQKIHDRNSNARENNPANATVGRVGGAVIGTIPMVMAAPAAFGAGPGSLLGRSLISGTTGATIGAADNAVRSDGDPKSVLSGAMWGAGTGVAGPAVGQALGAGYRAARGWLAKTGIESLAGMSREAIGRLARAMEADGLDAAAVKQRLSELGEGAMIADVGPNFQQMAAGLVARPGEARGIVQGAVRAREAGANERILRALDDTLGPAPVPSEIQASIGSRQSALSPQYREVLQNADPVDTSQIATYLDREAVSLRGDAQRGLMKIRKMLDRTGTDRLETNPAVLHETRKAVDGMLETATDSNARNALMTARQAIDDQLRAAVPGIKKVDAQFQELASQKDAVQRGQQLLDSGRTAPRPAEISREVEEGALPKGEFIGPSAAPMRLREGARAEIDRIVGTNVNDRVALQRIIKGEGDWNRARLGTLFGKDKADRILQVLDAERAFADTANFVTRNSATAARIEAANELSGEAGKSFGPREGYMAGGILGGLRSTVVRALEKGLESARHGTRDASNAGLALGLTTRNYDQVVEALTRFKAPKGISQSQMNVVKALMLGGGIDRAR